MPPHATVSVRVLLLAATVAALPAADRYVRAGAAGDGRDWANALPALPATLVRGDTWWIADGTYPGYRCDDPVSGTTPITLRKATRSAHGTATGWNDAYGDGSARFTGQLDVRTSHWVIDGVVGGGPGNWTGTVEPFGFVVVNTGPTPVIRSENARHLAFRHLEVQGNGGSAQGGGSVGNDGFAFYGGGDILVSRCYAHTLGRCVIFGGSDRTTFEWCYTGRFTSTSAVHSEIASIWGFGGIPTDHWTFRHNVFAHLEGTGGLIMEGDGLEVHGNVFFRPPGVTYNTANGAVGTWTASRLTNVRIANNSFIDLGGMPALGIFTADDTGVVENNIFWRTQVGSTGGLTLRTNDTPVADPFVAWTALDFRLRAATATGSVLTGAFATDPLGIARGADGVWDRGAYEFTSVSTPPPPPGTLPLTGADIGGVAATGSTSGAGSAWTLRGSGADIWGASDEGHFARVAVTGDVRITARVDGLDRTDAWAKAGVMIRESAAATSRHAFTCVTPGNGIAYQRRVSTGASSAHTAGPLRAAPYWVRLERVGGTVTSSCSADGITWRIVRQESIPLPATVLVGLAVTSHHDGQLCTARFSQVSIVAAASAAQ